MTTSSTLFAGNLHALTSEADLYNIFAANGVTYCVIVRDKSTKKSRGFGFITFNSFENATKAFTEKNQILVRSKHLNLQVYREKSEQRGKREANLIIKNITSEVSVQTIYEALETFGKINSFKWCTGYNGESLGYGYIQYDNKEDAEKAVKAVDNILFHDKTVRLYIHVPKNERQCQSTVISKNLYVNNFLKSDENEIKEIFEKIGNVTSSLIKYSDQHEKCYGFFCYETSEEAEKAMSILNCTIVGSGNKLFVNEAKTKFERQNELQIIQQDLKTKLYEETKNRNLYIKGLPLTWTTKDLNDLFEAYGEISNCKIATDNEGKSRGFGFVCFKTVEAAVKVINDQKNINFVSNNILIDYFQSREERNYELSSFHNKERQKMEKQNAIDSSQISLMGQTVVYPAYQNMDLKQFAYAYRVPSTSTGIRAPVYPYVRQIPQYMINSQQIRHSKQFEAPNEIQKSYNYKNNTQNFFSTSSNQVIRVYNGPQKHLKNSTESYYENFPPKNQLKKHLSHVLKKKISKAFFEFIISTVPKGTQIDILSEDELLKLQQEFSNSSAQ